MGRRSSRTGPFCELTRIRRNVVTRLPLSFAIVVSKSAPSAKLTSQHIVWELACKSSDLQTLSVGSKSQMIGVKEQGRACGCSLAYMGKSFIPLAEQFPLAMAHRHNMVVSEHHSREDAEPALTDWSNENVEIAGGDTQAFDHSHPVDGVRQAASALSGAELQKKCRDINAGRGLAAAKWSGAN